MKILKWYSGGKDRGERANDIIGQLLLDLNHDPKNEHLEAILINYQNEIKRKERGSLKVRPSRFCWSKVPMFC